MAGDVFRLFAFLLFSIFLIISGDCKSKIFNEALFCGCQCSECVPLPKNVL